MSVSTFMHALAPDVVKVVEEESRGVSSIDLSRTAIGYVLKGCKRIYRNDRSIEIASGEMFLLTTGVHYEENIPLEGAFEQVVFYVTSESLQRVIIELNTNYGLAYDATHRCGECQGAECVVACPTTALSDLFQGLNRLLRRNELRENGIGRQIKLNELVYLILTEGSACMRARLLTCSDVVNNHFAREVYNNLFTDLSIEALARKTNRSLTSFKKEFRRQFAEPPHRWFIDQRLQRAKILLFSTNLTISEIGNQCAFTNISHFIKLFKQRYGDTPAALRRHTPTDK